LVVFLSLFILVVFTLISLIICMSIYLVPIAAFRVLHIRSQHSLEASQWWDKHHQRGIARNESEEDAIEVARHRIQEDQEGTLDPREEVDFTLRFRYVFFFFFFFSEDRVIWIRSDGCSLASLI
jgi:hypothetical protein